MKRRAEPGVHRRYLLSFGLAVEAAAGLHLTGQPFLALVVTGGAGMIGAFWLLEGYLAPRLLWEPEPADYEDVFL